MEKRSIKFITIPVILILAVFISGCSEKEEDEIGTKSYSYFYPAKNGISETAKNKTVYLPVYSHVYTSEEKFEPMGITLSIRNTDSNRELILKEISYYNTSGELIEKFISKPHILKAMASIDFIVDLRDMRGGSGANFIVKWETDQKLSTPLIQAVMVNNSGNRPFSFITNAHKID